MNLLNHYPEIVAAYPEYITQKQLCEVCGVCHKTAYNLERRGEIPYKVVDTPTGRIQTNRCACLSLQERHALWER